MRMGYKSITSEALAEAVAAALPEGRIVADKAKHVAPDHVLLSRRRAIVGEACYRCARGGKIPVARLRLQQKFVGRALTVKGGHGVEHPVVMDACVEQLDGYRFVYLLPFDAETIFVEDTYYSDDADLDVAVVGERIAAYAAAQGVGRIGGNARGNRRAARRDRRRFRPPVARLRPHRADWNARRYLSCDDRLFVARRGANRGRPSCARRPLRPSRTPPRPRGGGVAASAFLSHARRDALRAAEPDERYRVFERFYRLAPGLIARFMRGGRGLRTSCAFWQGSRPFASVARWRRFAASTGNEPPRDRRRRGFGGLALAIRLQSAGVETTVVEARDKPGGRAYHWVKDGFTFDAGPTVITDPPCLQELWALSGQDMAADVDLVPVMPFTGSTGPTARTSTIRTTRPRSAPRSQSSTPAISRATTASSPIRRAYTSRAM